MSAKKSQFLSGFGKAFQIFKSLTDALLDVGGGDEDMGRILTDANLRADLAQRILESRTSAKGKGKTFPITVLSDEEISSDGRITAGRYDYVFKWPSGINRHNKCEMPRNTRVEIELITLEKIEQPHGQEGKRSATQQMARRGYRPANLSEMLAFGASYPDQQRKYEIATTGVVADHSDGQGDGVLKLDSSTDGRRNLFISFIDNFTFGGEMRFAVVKVGK